MLSGLVSSAVPELFCWAHYLYQEPASSDIIVKTVYLQTLFQQRSVSGGKKGGDTPHWSGFGLSGLGREAGSGSAGQGQSR